MKHIIKDNEGEDIIEWYLKEDEDGINLIAKNKNSEEECYILVIEEDGSIRFFEGVCLMDIDLPLDESGRIKVVE